MELRERGGGYWVPLLGTLTSKNKIKLLMFDPNRDKLFEEELLLSDFKDLLWLSIKNFILAIIVPVVNRTKTLFNLGLNFIFI